MRRAVWIDYQTEVDTDLFRYYDIEQAYLDAREATKEKLESARLRSLGGVPGVYFVWNHYPQMEGHQFADFCHNRLLEIGSLLNPVVSVDIEKGHGLNDSNFVDYLMSFARRWKQLRPKRDTSVTIEGRQGGLFNNRFQDVSWWNGSGLKLCPQAYTGSMVPHPAGLLENLMSYGFKREALEVFYDAAIFTEPIDGFLFTQQRLPR